MAPPPPPPKRGDPGATGKERNEYIPSFISQKPFYVAEDPSATSQTSDYLEHQRLQSEKDKQKETWYTRGEKLGPAATKFRKGACENCGAMGHQKKECFQRPRLRGAKHTGRDIQADDKIQDINLGWDAKRDRWNGFDTRNFSKAMQQQIERDKAKHKLRGVDEEEDANDGDNIDSAVAAGDKYEEETDMGRKQSTATRNLRIREDTAKYLLDLEQDSAKYDPKTRTMIDAGATGATSAALVAEEAFVKKSGDAAEFEAANRLAWDASSGGNNVNNHLQANPTIGEITRKKEAEEAKRKKEADEKSLAAKYGAQTTYKRNDKAPTVAENERYVEYDEKGKIKGSVPKKRKSKYPEDVMINNHTTVWGSWWKDFKWGYKCCHQTIKNSYCTGEAGKRALEEEDQLRNAEPEVESEEVPKQIAWEEEEAKEKHVPNAVDDDAKAALDEKKSRKRTAGAMADDVTEDQMEEFRRRKLMKDDPMAQMLGRDELI